jgi:putative inorganic carbon (HCO3(-)) transporter
MMFLYIILLTIFAIGTWKRLETGILLVCALLPSYLIRLNIGGIPTTFLEMMVLIVIAVWAIRRFPFRDVRADQIRPFLFPIALLLLAATIGIFISPDKFAAIGVWKAFFVEPILLFIIIQDTIKKSSSLQENIFKAFGLSALLVSLFGLIQYIFSIGIPAPWDLERRITSIFEYPNALALFLEPIIVISWFKLFEPSLPTALPLPSSRGEHERGAPSPKTERIFWLLVSVLSTINVFLAQSEAGIAALLITAVCILLFSKTTRQKTIVSVLLLSALVFAIPTSREYLVQKLTFTDFSEQVRLSQWRETFALLRDHPIVGAGLSGYPIIMKQYHQELAYEIFQYPHNIILNIWVELGLLGLFVFFFAIVQMIRSILTAKEGRALLLLAGFVFLEICIHGLVDVPYFKNDLALMIWILIACTTTIGIIHQKKS